MKNYLKFVVAVMGITIATFGTISKVNAKDPIVDKVCTGGGQCGTTPEGCTITGQPHNVPKVSTIN